jgi:peptidoglycan/xylan/chitin deacetylase (PgdA/CDA1 family)
MKKHYCLLFSVLIFVRMLAAQEIALTFDDAPIADGLYFTGVARTETLIAKLKNQNVPQVAFYCISSRTDSAGRVRLRKYAEAGHIIANHSHSHTRIQQLGAAGYIQDIFKADAILRELPGFKPWFRFPFLDEGRTIADRDAIRQALSEVISTAMLRLTIMIGISSGSFRPRCARRSESIMKNSSSFI